MDVFNFSFSHCQTSQIIIMKLKISNNKIKTMPVSVLAFPSYPPLCDPHGAVLLGPLQSARVLLRAEESSRLSPSLSSDYAEREASWSVSMPLLPFLGSSKYYRPVYLPECKTSTVSFLLRSLLWFPTAC